MTAQPWFEASSCADCDQLFQLLRLHRRPEAMLCHYEPLVDDRADALSRGALKHLAAACDSVPLTLARSQGSSAPRGVLSVTCIPPGG